MGPQKSGNKDRRRGRMDSMEAVTQVAQRVGVGDMMTILILVGIVLAIGIGIAPLFIWGHTYATSKTLRDIDATIRRLERLADKWEAARQNKD
jgi:hypothetical protein